MLESKEQSKHHRHLIMETKKGSRLSTLFHEGEIWSKEKSVIITSNDSLSRQVSAALPLQNFIRAYFVVKAFLKADIFSGHVRFGE